MPKTILLATDHLQVSGVFRRIAQEYALKVEVVSSVSDAVMAFVESMHDVVFLSPGLEGGKGMHLVKELASLSPRIVLVGEAQEGFEHVALPLIKSKVLALLGLEKKEAEAPQAAKAAVSEKAAVSAKTAVLEKAAAPVPVIVFKDTRPPAPPPEVAKPPLKAPHVDLSEQLALASAQKAQAEAKLQEAEKAISKLEEKLQLHRRLHRKLEAELETNRAEVLQLKTQTEAALQAQQVLKSQWELGQTEAKKAKEEVKNIELLLERALEERTLWQENKSQLSLEVQQLKEKLARTQEEKDKACLQLAEVSGQWKESEARLQAAVSSSAFLEAEMEALKLRTQQTEAACEAKNVQLEQQALFSQKRIVRMEEELVQLRSQVAKSEAEARAALAIAPSTLILPLSSPMPGEVFSALEECLQLLVQTVVTRPWLRLDTESRLGRRKLYICQGSLMGVDSNCPGDLLLKQAQRDGLLSAKQYKSLRLLEEKGPYEQLEVLLRKGFIREVEAEGLLQRYAERVFFEAMSEKEAAFALAEEKPGVEVTVLKKSQPLWPLLKEGMERRNAEIHFLERFGGKEAIPILKTSLAGLAAMGMSKTELQFFESMDAETKLEGLMEDFSFQPKQMVSMLLTAWKLGVIEFSRKRLVHAGASEVSTERLFARFEEIRDADYFGVLGVSPEASTRELKEAHMRLMEEFNPLKFAGHRDPKVLSCAEQLSALVEEAFGVLENESQRKEYANHLMNTP